jgi:hypothetical protein
MNSTQKPGSGITRPAAAAYATAKTEALHAIEELVLHVKAHGAMPDGKLAKIHYGHVGDMHHVLEKVRELNANFRRETP